MQSSQSESEETHRAVAPETERGETSLHALENETTMVGDAVRRTSIESLPDRRPQTVAVGDLEIRDFEGTTVRRNYAADVPTRISGHTCHYLVKVYQFITG